MTAGTCSRTTFRIATSTSSATSTTPRTSATSRTRASGCWLELTGGTKPEDINFIVAHAECDFRIQLRMEPIEICVRIGEMRTSSLDFLYEVRRGGEIAATGKVVVVLFDWKSNAKKPIDDDFRRKVAACAS